MCRLLKRKYKCCETTREIGILPCEWSHRTQPWTPCPEPAAEIRWDPEAKYCDVHHARETMLAMRATLRTKTLTLARRVKDAYERKINAQNKLAKELKKEKKKGEVVPDGGKKPRKPRKPRAKKVKEVAEASRPV